MYLIETVDGNTIQTEDENAYVTVTQYISADGTNSSTVQNKVIIKIKTLLEAMPNIYADVQVNHIEDNISIAGVLDFIGELPETSNSIGARIEDSITVRYRLHIIDDPQGFGERVTDNSNDTVTVYADDGHPVTMTIKNLCNPGNMEKQNDLTGSVYKVKDYDVQIVITDYAEQNTSAPIEASQAQYGLKPITAQREIEIFGVYSFEQSLVHSVDDTFTSFDIESFRIRFT